ncbi:putative iron-regulated membrane protein [Bradyrhizobium sp. S3.9.2]
MTRATAMLPAPNLTGRARRRLLWAHRWLGLLGGIVVVLIGLTGSFIVFYREIDAALNPALYTPAGREREATLSEVMRAAAAADPAPIATILAPDRTWPVWIVIHAHETAKGRYPNRWTTMVDPSNGKVLGRRDYVNAFSLKVYRLHYTLLLYEWWGKELVGVVGFMLLGLAMSGVIL